MIGPVVARGLASGSGRASFDGQKSGLDALLALAPSPDGKSLYAASAGDAAVARFDRDPATGALTYRDCISGATETGPTGTNACAQIPSATAGGNTSGLDVARALAVSSDGTSLYAVANGSIARFDRDPATGALAYRDCVSGVTDFGPTGTDACALLPINGSDGKRLQVVCQAKVKPIDYSLDEPAQGSVAVRFRSGDTEYCVVFGGTVAKDRQGKVFKATGAPAPGTCSGPPVACP